VERGNVLVVGLSQVSVSLLGLLLEELQSSLQALVLSTVLGALVDSGLCVLETTLDLLQLALEELVLVLQRGDFLLLGEVLLLKRLDLCLELLVLGSGLVGLEAEGVHALSCRDKSAWLKKRWGMRGSLK
jgi:hypothetical protein